MTHIERAKRGWVPIHPLCPECNRQMWNGGNAARPSGPSEYRCECGWVGMASQDIEWYVQQAIADARPRLRIVPNFWSRA